MSMRGVKKGFIRMTYSHRLRECQTIGKKSLEYELWYFKYDYCFKDFRNSAEKYIIENEITSRHVHARCQEWCHSNGNFT